MHRLLEMNLAIFLMLILGLSPLHGLSTTYSHLPSQAEEGHQWSVTHDGGIATTVDRAASVNCSQYVTDSGCIGYSCPSGHSAASCVPALLTDSVPQANAAVALHPDQEREVLPLQPFSSHFRPPRPLIPAVDLYRIKIT